MSNDAIKVSGLEHRYGDHQAVAGISFNIEIGEVFGFLGPNGGGKTTLFRVLSTLIPKQTGEVSVFGASLPELQSWVRQQIGVVFQAPSLDKKLTVLENLVYQAKLFGLSNSETKERCELMLNRLGVWDRKNDLTEKLSGGLRRRVELAKSLLHEPKLLLLDEPSTGLDPGARASLWEYLLKLREEHNVTVVLTTHLLEEAERADRLAILNRGEIVALDTPDALRASVGGDSITIHSDDATSLIDKIQNQFDVTATMVDQTIRIQQGEAQKLFSQIVESFGDHIKSITLGKPTLEDVFIERTGHTFWGEEQEES